MSSMTGICLFFLGILVVVAAIAAIIVKCSLSEIKEKKRKQDEYEQAKKDKKEAAAQELAAWALRQQEAARQNEEERRAKKAEEKEWVETARALCETKGANLFDALASKNVSYGLYYLRLDDLEKYWTSKRLPEYWARRTVVYTDNFSSYDEFHRAWQLVGRDGFSDEASNAYVKSAPNFVTRRAVIKSMKSHLTVTAMLFDDFSKEIAEQTTLAEINVLKKELSEHPFGWDKSSMKWEIAAYALVRAATLRVVKTHEQITDTKTLREFIEVAENLECHAHEEYLERGELCDAIYVKLLQLDPFGQLEFLTEDRNLPSDSPYRWVLWTLASLTTKEDVLAFQDALTKKCQEQYKYDINRRLVEIELQ